tara:strand:- start:397 stop:579 length:183 start_codon:yes stop_codon:yes gene_type:complete
MNNTKKHRKKQRKKQTKNLRAGSWLHKLALPALLTGLTLSQGKMRKSQKRCKTKRKQRRM